jgi:zinc protease
MSYRSWMFPLTLAAAVTLSGCVASAAPGADATLSPAAAAPTTTAVLTEGATVEGITEYTLDNGLRVLLFPDASSPTATVNITYLVGSRHEAYGETGMAHLLEHLLFKGTPSHPNIPQELTERGASPNGTTWFDRTNYFETFAATEDNLEWALGLEADRMVNSFVAAEDLESEMTVVRNEFESGENSPFRVLMQRLMSSMYLWHNYGNSTIGSRADLENVPIERLQSFYRRYYQPDNAILVVAGRFEPDLVKELVVEKFGVIPRPDRTGELRIYPTYTRDPVQDGERSVTLRRVGDVQLAGVSYHVAPGPHEDWAALDVLDHVLTNAPTGRLHKELVETGKATSVNGLPFQLREPSPFMIFAQVREQGSLDDAEATMLRVIDNLPAEPVTDAEVDRARAALLRQIELAFNNSQMTALRLSEWAAMGDWRLMFIHRDRIERVTADDVNAVVRRYFVPSNRTLARFVPTQSPVRAQIPASPNVDSLVADYRGRAAVAVGEAFDPSPENIDRRIQRFTLANGIEVALLPKSTRGEAVQASITVRFGTPDMLMGKSTVGTMTGAMLMRGTTERSRAEIQDAFDALNTQASIGGSVNRGFAQLTTTRANLAPALELTAEVLRRPAFEPSEFEQLKQQRITAIESQRSEPNAQAFRAISRHGQPWPEGHPNYTPTFEEDVAETEAVTVQEVAAYYERMYAPASGTIVVVGDFDPAQIRAVLEREVGTWQQKVPFERIATPFHQPPPTDIEIETPDKAQAIFLARQTLNISDTHPDYPALVLGNFMLGGGFLNSRLATRIRQQEGLSYGVSSQLSAPVLDHAGTFMVFAIYAPENKDRLEAAFRDEMQKLFADGFTADELEAARNGWLQQRTVQRSNDQFLRTVINNHVFYERTMAFERQLEDAVRALTVDDVNRAMRQHIDLDAMVFVKAGDFAGQVANTR